MISRETSAVTTRPRQAVILAGGRGRRMRPFSDTAPKHMYRFNGRPLAHWLVEQLAEQGFERVLFLLGYLPGATREYFSRDGFGTEIEYAVTPAGWETAARLTDALPRLDESFMLCYSDNYWPLQARRLCEPWLRSGALAQLTVYANGDGFTRSNVEVEDGRIKRYDAARASAGLAGVDIGYALVRRCVVEQLGGAAASEVSFQQAAYPELAARGQLAAYVTGHRYYGVGDAGRLAAAGKFLARRPAVLVDRDGVLNRRPRLGEYVKSAGEWEWLPGACEALARFHRAGYRVIVITNQAGVARGEVTAEALEAIHARLRSDVEAAGGRVEAIYCCPHHWDAGCACRKPRPGMLFQAQREFHLDLTRTWFLGDDARDAEAAEAAGCLYAEVSAHTPLASYADAWLRHSSFEKPFEMEPTKCELS